MPRMKGCIEFKRAGFLLDMSSERTQPFRYIYYMETHIRTLSVIVAYRTDRSLSRANEKLSHRFHTSLSVSNSRAYYRSNAGG